MRLWLIFMACGTVTFATRASFITLGDRLPLPDSVERALRYVAPAAFAAISVPLILGGDGVSNFSADLPRIIAACAAALAVFRLKNIPSSLLTGMVVLWLLEWAGL